MKLKMKEELIAQIASGIGLAVPIHWILWQTAGKIDPLLDPVKLFLTFDGILFIVVIGLSMIEKRQEIKTTWIPILRNILLSFLFFSFLVPLGIWGIFLFSIRNVSFHF